MPLMRCRKDGRKGWKYGNSGVCYIGTDARGKAEKQGRAIEVSKAKRDARPIRRKDLPAKSKVPYRQREGRTIARSYTTAIKRLIEPQLDIVKKELDSAIPRIVATYKMQTKVDSDSYGVQITNVFTGIRDKVGFAANERETEIVSQRFATRTEKFQRRQFDNQFKAVLGISLALSEPYLKNVVSSFVAENVSRISSIAPDMVDKMESTIRLGVEAGDSTKTIQDKIVNDFKIPASRAKLIAVDQIAKFNGKLTELRHKEAGVKKYIWSDSDDRRVRRSHQGLDETVQRWDKPPVSGVGGERLHPGMPVRCRCVAIPVFEGFTI